jgi:hypothetical protein
MSELFDALPPLCPGSSTTTGAFTAGGVLELVSDPVLGVFAEVDAGVEAEGTDALDVGGGVSASFWQPASRMEHTARVTTTHFRTVSTVPHPLGAPSLRARLCEQGLSV